MIKASPFNKFAGHVRREKMCECVRGRVKILYRRRAVRGGKGRVEWNGGEGDEVARMWYSLITDARCDIARG